MSSSVLTARSLEPALDSVSPNLSAPPQLVFYLCFSKINKRWGAWVAQLVKHPTLAQIMISQFVSSSPTLGFVLEARSLEPALDSVSLSLSLSLHPPLSLKNK